MDLPVTLAGHSATWTFHGSRDLDSWIESQPWLRGGGVVTIHLGPGTEFDTVVDALRRAVRAADDAGYQPTVLPLLVDDDIRSSLSEALCGSAAVPDRQLAEECAYKHKVIVALSSDGGVAAREAAEFSDVARKLVPDFSTAFVVTATATEAEDEALDFATGVPRQQLLRLFDETRERVFRAYLHVRIAWESGGCLSAARELDSAAIAIPIGDDEAFEAVLNRSALSKFEGLAADVQRCTTDIVHAVSRRRPMGTLAVNLLRERVLWAPLERRRLALVPWAARALLLRGGGGETTELLRNHVTCAPLARELLGRCLDLEARERARLAYEIGALAPPTDAVVRFSAFERGDPFAESGLYPRSSPARPSDAWAFAEFGACIEAAERSGSARQPRSDHHALRRLRNALAHGHYAGWAAVRQLIEAEERLGVGYS